MIENIMTYVSGAIILLVGLFAYVYLIAYVLPLFLIRPVYNNDKIGDRGIKKYIFDNGRAIVYDPSIEVKKYIDQYVLFDDGKKRCLQCKITDDVYSIKLRVLTFDSSDKPLGVFIAKDLATGKNTTGIIELPIETAYVSIEVAEVNNNRMNLETRVGFSVVKLGIYCLSTVIITVIEAILIKTALLMVADAAFGYSNAVGRGMAFTVFTALLLGLAASVLIVMTHSSKEITNPLKCIIDGVTSWVSKLLKK